MHFLNTAHSETQLYFKLDDYISKPHNLLLVYFYVNETLSSIRHNTQTFSVLFIRLDLIMSLKRYFGRVYTSQLLFLVFVFT